MKISNALTIDVEDYYQVSGFERGIRREDWGDFPSRVVQNTRRILEHLDRHSVKATFFVLGWVAEHFPTLVQEIDRSGHEIGSHSYWHRLVYQLSRDEFRDDLRRSRDVLEDLIDKPVVAYRAPSFSITTQSLWAFDILAEEGFEVDMSVFPAYHHRCGIPDAPDRPHVYDTDYGPICEIPISIARCSQARLPISGGGYFRLFPYCVSRRLLARRNEKLGEPFVFYTHPWEFDPEQPRLKVSTPAMRFRHYVNLKSSERKFELLLSQFRFDRVDRVYQAFIAGNRRGTASTTGEAELARETLER